MSSILTPPVAACDRESTPQASGALARFLAVRDMTDRLVEPLSPEDCVVQSMPDASPAKWHLAHTTWFFETFILCEHLRGYRVFHPQFSFLFNSYYNAVGDRIARPTRGLMTRPSLDEVRAYRRHIDGAMRKLLGDADDAIMASVRPLLEIGLNHEQQHQELLLTDIKHLLWMNPLKPAYRERCPDSPSRESRSPDALNRVNRLGEPGHTPPLHGRVFDAGVYEIGYGGDGFAFDNESPRHKVYLDSFSIASRLVTNGEFIRFIDDGGYQRPELWLDMGWAKVRECGWQHPMYWERGKDGSFTHFTLGGMQPVSEHEPVCHVSYFEADAYARWSGARLSTEQEWEVAAADIPIEGNFVERGELRPLAASFVDSADGRRPTADSLHQMFGDAWEWTRSQYSPYPGYAPAAGAIGEYNGKFMCNQFVLRGGSCATPQSHIRASYRNFFPPEARWQFTGIRLAKDIA